MKRLILTTIFVFSMSIISFAAEDEISNKEYINTLNNYIGEMKNETDIKEGNLLSSIIVGFDNGYLNPDIERLSALKYNCDNIYNDLKDLKLEDKIMQNKHNELISKYKDVSNKLNDVLIAKEKLLNKDILSFVKIGKTIFIDTTKTHLANEEIENLNNIYKDINSYYK